jgi:hypothetical protein
MSSTIILNSNNRSSSNSSRYEYVFPSTVKFGKGATIALQSFAMFNSFFNVEAQRGNNQFKIHWHADTSTEYTITLPDGYYSLQNLNRYLQNFCLFNDLYMKDSNDNDLYFIEILPNEVRYAAEVDLTALPTAATASTLGWTVPVGASWSLPVTPKSPQLEILTSPFGSLLGMQIGIYPSSVLAEDSQHLSSGEIQISPTNSVILGCNLISSAYSNPSHLFYSIPLTEPFGRLITHNASSVIINNITPGSYGKISIDLYSQNFESLRFIDSEIVIVLQIFKPEE